MRVADENVKSIVPTIDLLGRTIGVETVFRDWCECAALAFANGCDVLHGARWEAREKRYFDIIRRYKEPALFAEMLAYLTNAFEADPWQDHLGRIYMECFGGNKNLGQCFTPAGVCECCASLVGVPEPGKPSSLYEPARVEAAGYKIVLSVHDELITETPDTPDYTAEKLAAMMAMPPKWAADLPLAAAGFEAYRYKKD